MKTDMRFDTAKSWPFVEARAVIERLGRHNIEIDADRPVVFETGYGPSGLPHIGTFGEVVRTMMVRHAFECLTGLPTRLICFSDDMDGLRSVPDNIPQKALMAEHLGKPLTEVPDPFGTHDSFGSHNNARLKAFLDGFGFEYEFFSATDCYRSGRFDEALMTILKHYAAIVDVILPTLGEERRASYSPFLPICPDTRQVLQVPIIAHDANAGTVEYRNPRDTAIRTVPVTGGGCKLQWKCDWAMRWVALGVDYEMSGKDLSESVILSSKITRIMGGVPPAGISYELFLDEFGHKISKSKGNGLSVDEWLTYGSAESLKLFMYNNPKRAKKLFFDSIPKAVDEYYKHLGNYADADPQCDNPVWHIHEGKPPAITMPITFSLLLNLASACQAATPAVIWGYLQQYDASISPETHSDLAVLVDKAVAYYQDRIRPHNHWRPPTPAETQALALLDRVLEAWLAAAQLPAETITSRILEALRDTDNDETGLYAPSFLTNASLSHHSVNADKVSEVAHAVIEDWLALTHLPKTIAAIITGATVEAYRNGSPHAVSADKIQETVFAVGMESGYENLRDWFKALYETLLGQEAGPRMGSFISLYGIAAMRQLIAQGVSGELASKSKGEGDVGHTPPKHGKGIDK